MVVHGAGVSINPVAFLVVQKENVKIIPVEHDTYIDRILDYVPDLLQKMNFKDVPESSKNE